MDNPWKEIPLWQYESHMGLDSIKQLQTLNRAMKDQLERYPAASVIILGVAGGNGLEHVDADRHHKVYGVDVNPLYLQATERRYGNGKLAEILECLCLDLTTGADRLPKVELLIANLLIEYIGYSAFLDAVRGASPRYVSCIIQGDDADGFVSTSPYLHVFDGLDAVHHPIEEAELSRTLMKAGYRRIASAQYPLPNRKKLIRADYAAEQHRC